MLATPLGCQIDELRRKRSERMPALEVVMITRKGREKNDTYYSPPCSKSRTGDDWMTCILALIVGSLYTAVSSLKYLMYLFCYHKVRDGDGCGSAAVQVLADRYM